MALGWSTGEGEDEAERRRGGEAERRRGGEEKMDGGDQEQKTERDSR